MVKITIDSNQRIHVPDPNQPFTVCDEAGKIIGSYIPAKSGPPISREEIDRRKKQKNKSFTTAEVLAHLEKL